MPLDEKRLCVVLGDASGKGIRGERLMARAQAVVQAEARPADSPARWLARVNRRVYDGSLPDQLVTLFCAILSASGRDIRYVNAGHPQALLFSGERVQVLRATGPPLGVFEDSRYDEQVVVPEPGDLLVIYSDGITEAQTSCDDFFGEDRVRAVIRRLRHRSASAIAQALCDEACRFERDSPDGGDDKAVVVARVTGR